MTLFRLSVNDCDLVCVIVMFVCCVIVMFVCCVIVMFVCCVIVMFVCCVIVMFVCCVIVMRMQVQSFIDGTKKIKMTKRMSTPA